MKNHVTPETAKKLMEADFGQPEYEYGQVWYNKNGIAFIVSKFHDKLIFGQIDFSSGIAESPKGMIFAATAPDILRELGYGHTLHHEDIFFCIYEPEPDGFNTKAYENDNSSEACASAWLSKNAKA